MAEKFSNFPHCIWDCTKNVNDIGSHYNERYEDGISAKVGMVISSLWLSNAIQFRVIGKTSTFSP